MPRFRYVAQVLADALLAGSPDPAGFHERAASCFEHKQRWLPGICRRAFRKFGSSLLHRDRGTLIEWIENDLGYRTAWESGRVPRVVHVFLDPPRMAPREGVLAACDLPSIATPGELATWLGVTPGELDWLADLRRMNPSAGPLAHYRYKWIDKSIGQRLVEIPKSRLRKVQRRILRGILDAVPAHGAAHGFRRGRSCLSYAKPHIGKALVLRMDLREFFPSIPAPRVHALFEKLGYPVEVAAILTGLCTNAVPMSVARRGAATWLAAKRLGVPHLPQGAPTSPALANLCALHLDFRLEGLARSMGAAYSRYADDLALSGGEDFRRRSAAVARTVAAIAVEEGFELHPRKTRAMGRAHRQILTGIVVNEKSNVSRAEWDRLKAVLTNCLRHGPGSQNRGGVCDFRAHVAGRIAHVGSINPARAKKLQSIFERVDWSADSERRPE
jgi:hypothetical protein